MDQPAKLAALMADHRRSFSEVITIAERNPGNYLLFTFAKQARSGLAALTFELSMPTYGTHGSLGHWGPNGNAPKIAMLVSMARNVEKELHREPLTN